MRSGKGVARWGPEPLPKYWNSCQHCQPPYRSVGVAEAGTRLNMQEVITIRCMDCKHRNYSTTKNKKNVTDRLELKKYCKWCRRHTSHREVR